MDKDSVQKQQDRRSGNDRRHFTFTLHIPERRSGVERRIPEGPKEKSKSASQKHANRPKESESPEKP